MWRSLLVRERCVLIVGIGIVAVSVAAAYGATIESSLCTWTEWMDCRPAATPAPFAGCTGRPETSCGGTVCYNCDGSWEEGHKFCFTIYSEEGWTCNALGNPLSCGDMWRRSCYWTGDSCLCRSTGGTKEGGCTLSECDE